MRLRLAAPFRGDLGRIAPRRCRGRSRVRWCPEGRRDNPEYEGNHTGHNGHGNHLFLCAVGGAHLNPAVSLAAQGDFKADE